MAEYIDRNALIDNLQKFAPDCYNAAVNNVIVGMPKADVAPVVHGHWEKADGFGYYKCSNCRTVDDKYYQPDYCPNCGSKMDGGDSDEAD